MIGDVSAHLMVDPTRFDRSAADSLRALRPAPAARPARHPRTGCVHDPPPRGSTERRPRRAVARVRPSEGVGGYPLLLLHGYPETKRIWWRNIARAGRGRLRGDRARPARLRRLRPVGRRCLRPRRLEPRPLPARARRARPRSLRRGRWRPRRRRRRRPPAPLPGLRREARLLRHRAAVRLRRLRRGRHRRRVDPRHRRRADRATTATCRARRRTSWPPNSTHRPSAGATSPGCTATGCGRRRARSPPRTSTS